MNAYAIININTEPEVFIYIFSLAADYTVTILYPNKYMKNEPLSSANFIFPPLVGKIKQLELYPLEKGKKCKEKIKIIASRKKLDFSSLPFPENRVYIGTEGKNIEKLLDILKIAKNSAGFSETVLTYCVGGK